MEARHIAWDSPLVIIQIICFVHSVSDPDHRGVDHRQEALAHHEARARESVARAKAPPLGELHVGGGMHVRPYGSLRTHCGRTGSDGQH